MVRTRNHARQVTDEVDIDVRGYVAHPHCRRLVCYVYDPKRYIKDPRTVERDLSGEASQGTKIIEVRIVVGSL